MYGVSYEGEGYQWADHNWGHVLSHFGVIEIYERGDSPYGPFSQTIDLKDASELPADRPLVVAAPEHGEIISGSVDLVDFNHPDDAIYFFGRTWEPLEVTRDLGGRIPEYTVYIPGKKYDLFPYSACAIFLWDRYLKRGGAFG